MPLVLGLYKEDAGVYDWHKPLIGKPLLAQQADRSWIVATERNVLARLDIAANSDGSELRWRRSLAETPILLRVNGQVVVTAFNHSVEAWNIRTGALLWTKHFPINTESGVDVAFNGLTTIVSVGDRSIVALSNKGKKLWDITSTANNDLLSLHLIAVSKDSLKVLSASREGDALKLRSFGLSDGQLLDEVTVKHHSYTSAKPFIIQTEQYAFAVWSSLKADKTWAVRLDSEASVFELPQSAGFKAVPFPSNGPMFAFLLEKEGQKPQIASITADGRIEVSQHPVSSKVDTKPIVGISGSADAYFVAYSSRMDNSSGKYSISIRQSSLPLSDVEIAFDGPVERFFFAQVATKQDGIVSSYIFLLLKADGSIECVDGNKRSLWSREESLTLAKDAVFLDLPVRDVVTEQYDELKEPLEVSKSLSVAGRLARRLKTHFERLVSFAVSFGVAPKKDLGSANGTSAATLLTDDGRGFHKLFIVISSTGKVNALDSTNGKVVWSRFFDASLESIHIIRPSLVQFPPLIGIFAGSANQSSHFFRLDGITGNDFKSSATGKEFPKNVREVYHTGVVDRDDHTQVFALRLENDRIALFPDTPSAHSAFDAVRSSWYYYEFVNDSAISSFHLDAAKNADNSYSREKIWSMTFPDGEKLVKAAQDGDVAHVPSIGRVLGDRKVLYKFLNPNTLSFVTLKHNPTTSDASTTFVYVLDAVSGAIHYRHAHHAAGQASQNAPPSIHLLQCENWVVYSVWNHGPEALDDHVWNSIDNLTPPAIPTSRKKINAANVHGVKSPATRPITPDAKQVELVVLEIYESVKPDTRIESDKLSSFASSNPGILAQTFTFPYPISALGVTKTVSGITSREILVGIDGGRLYGLNKRLLDPRRPIGSLSAEDKEEALIIYHPSLGLNAKEIASYSLSLLGIENILSASTNRESTSIVIGYGLDIFCTRRTPSQSFDVLSPDFGYSGLLATIAGLLIAIAVARSFAERKKINDSWK